MSIFARKWTPRAHGGKADLFKNDQKMIENDQEMIENDQEMIENDQKSHGALTLVLTLAQAHVPEQLMNYPEYYKTYH